MRKRLAIAGHSDEGLGLIPLLEANPDVELCAILTENRELALDGLRRVDRQLADSFAARITIDADAVLRMPGLVALIDADLSPTLRDVLVAAPERGIQVTSPLIAKLLYAFGPVDATRKPDLLQSLSEILESYNLTADRTGLLNRVLQIAVGSTGADRGSLMLYDPAIDAMRVEVAIGLERELIPKIRVASGEGVAGRAFADRLPLLVHGRADHERYRIVRERSDVESAISAPLIHGDEVLGVLNLSHSLRSGAFTQEDLDFVERLARIDARIITRAEEYHRLVGDSARLRAQARVRELLAEPGSLPERLSKICNWVAEELNGGLCHVYLYEAELDLLHLRGSSAVVDPLGAALQIPVNGGIHGFVARSRKPVVLSQAIDHTRVCFAVLPLTGHDQLVGLLSFEGAVPGEPPEVLKEKISAAAEALGSELADKLRQLTLERDASRTSAMTQLAARMGSAHDSAELHRSITSSAAVALEAEHAVLRVQDPATGQYQIRSYFGSAEPEQQSQLFEFEKQLSIAAISQRMPVRVLDRALRPEFATFEVDVHSALVFPLRREGRVAGTLSVMGKVASDPLSGTSFLEADQDLLAQFCEHAERALEQVQEREWSRHNLRFDGLTGLPNAAHLTERIEEEIARSSGAGRKFAVIRLRIPGLNDILADQEEAQGDRLVLAIAHDIRMELREFDVVARTAPDTFEILVPEPGSEISALLGPLARRARDAMRRDTDPTVAGRLDLEFGYALFPDDAQTSRGLQDHATQPRISTRD